MPAPSGRRRALQVTLLLAGVLAVLVGDRTATALGAATAPGAASAVVSIGAFLVGGWAVGMALRLQVAPAARGDRRGRLLLGVPCGVLAGLPLLLSGAPVGLVAAAPGWLIDMQRIAPFGGAALGVVLALAVIPRGRRRS